jgi:hypothetical protein
MYEKRVERGMALLDRHDPDWFGRIDLETLRMETCNRCILGQLHGHAWIGFRRILEDLPSTSLYSAAHHGFTLYNSEQASCNDQEFSAVRDRFGALGLAWRTAIESRRAAASSLAPSLSSP